MVITKEKCEKILLSQNMSEKDLNKINHFSVREAYKEKYFIYPTEDYNYLGDLGLKVLDYYVYNHDNINMDDDFKEYLEKNLSETKLKLLSESSQKRILFLIDLIVLRFQVDKKIKEFNFNLNQL